MSSNLRSVYLYLVCLITLIIFIISFIMFTNHLVDLVFQDSYYQEYEDYKLRYTIRNEKAEIEEYSLSQEEMKANYDEYIENEKNRTFKRNLKNLFSSLAAMIISFVFWIYHWKKVMSEKR